AYRPAGERPTGEGKVAVARAASEWKKGGTARTTVSYDWDAGSGSWVRIQNNVLHTDAAGRKVAPTNVIFQFVTYHNTGLVDSSGTEVPEADVVGEGDAWVLTGGVLIPARWSKPQAGSVTRYVDGNGADIRLAPGRTWVELAPPGRASYVQRPPDPPQPASAAPPASAPGQEPQAGPEAPPSQPPSDPQPAPTPAPPPESPPLISPPARRTG
ncbi:MAG: DUF3048 C-terminal domain-containing protein, partial [Anaerolineales bacterium]